MVSETIEPLDSFNSLFIVCMNQMNWGKFDSFVLIFLMNRNEMME